MRLHQARIIATLEKHGGECTYGELVEVGEEHQCDTVGSMIKYLKNKKVIHFDKSYLMFPSKFSIFTSLIGKRVAVYKNVHANFSRTLFCS